MKKLLLMSLGVVSFVAIDAKANGSDNKFMMSKTYQKSDASMIQFDQRRVNATVQRTATYARDGIIAVLAAAENEGLGGGSGYNQTDGVANLRKVAKDSFIGFADSNGLKINEDGAIQFVMDPSEIDSGIGIGKYTITYYPVVVGEAAENSMSPSEQYIDGWTCKTTASTETRLGRGHVTHSEDSVEPMFMGLGYPFELCTIVKETPDITNIN